MTDRHDHTKIAVEYPNDEHIGGVSFVLVSYTIMLTQMMYSIAGNFHR